MKTARIALILIAVVVLSGLACAEINTEAKDIFDRIICNAVCFLRYIVVAVAAIAMVVAGARYASTDDARVRIEMKWQMIYAIFGLVIVVFGLPLANMITEELFSPFNCDCAALPDRITDFTQAFTCELICLAVVITASLCALTIIYAGIRYMTSGDDPATRRQMRNLAAYSLIGLLIVIFALPIVNFVAGDELEELDCDCMKFTSSKDKGDKLTITSVGTEEGTGGETVEMSSETAEQEETEEAPNKPPVAVAKVGFHPYETGDEATLNIGEGMRFFAEGSNDPDGSIKSYLWDFGDGVTEETAEKQTHHVYGETGEYTASLTVTDDKEAKGRDDVKVTVRPRLVAEARAGTDPGDISHTEVSINSGETVYFDASGSTLVGAGITYLWSFDFGDETIKIYDGPDAIAQHDFTCVRDEECVYSVKLFVTNLERAMSADSVTVKVSRDPAVIPPKAVALVSTTEEGERSKSVTVRVGEITYLYCSESSDPDGVVEMCEWKIGESVTGTSWPGVLGHPFHSPGDYTVTLFATDNVGAKGRDEVVVKVIPWEDNVDPTAVITVGSSSGEVTVPDSKTLEVEYGQVLYFYGDESSDSDGEIRKRTLYYDSEDSFAFEDEMPLLFRNLGEHTIILTVTDDKGCMGRDEVKVVVKEAAEIEPGFTLLFIPLNWDGSLDSFSDEADRTLDSIVRKLPLKDCPETVKSIKIGKECQIERQSFIKERDLYFRIHECVDSSGETDYDYIIGLTDALKYGCQYLRNTEVLLVQREFYEDGAVHELGHAFGLVDEYFDICRCYEPGPNCLDESMGGSDPNVPFFEGYCAGGDECEKNAVCKGNLNQYGGRCIMSYLNADRPREFCPHCMAHLSSIQELRCEP